MTRLEGEKEHLTVKTALTLLSQWCCEVVLSPEEKCAKASSFFLALADVCGPQHS